MDKNWNLSDAPDDFCRFLWEPGLGDGTGNLEERVRWLAYVTTAGPKRYSGSSMYYVTGLSGFSEHPIHLRETLTRSRLNSTFNVQQ